MDARTRFLSSAALSYATIVPATAAHLASRSCELAAADSGTFSTGTAMMPCVACGWIDIPGWTSRREVIMKGKSGTQRAMRSRRKLGNDSAPNVFPKGSTKSTVTTKVLKTECSRCRRTTESAVQAVDRVKNPMKADDNRKQHQAAEQGLPRGKRSKTRRKSGLLAILAKSKGASTPAPGLDLMDLMKVV